MCFARRCVCPCDVYVSHLYQSSYNKISIATTNECGILKPYERPIHYNPQVPRLRSPEAFTPTHVNG
jgi:hypothetical protein